MNKTCGWILGGSFVLLTSFYFSAHALAAENSSPIGACEKAAVPFIEKLSPGLQKEFNKRAEYEQLPVVLAVEPTEYYEETMRILIQKLRLLESSRLEIIGPLWAPEWPDHLIAIQLPKSLLRAVMSWADVKEITSANVLVELGDPQPGTPEHFEKAQIEFYQEQSQKEGFAAYGYGQKMLKIYVKTADDIKKFPKEFRGYPVEIEIYKPLDASKERKS